MEDTTRWDDLEDETISPFTPPEHDKLGVLTSTRYVVEVGERVWINREQIEQLSRQWIHTFSAPSIEDIAMWENSYHFFDGTERTVNWMLLLDALNFCFWAEKDSPRWQIEYEGETREEAGREILNGYWAEAASLTRAVHEGIPLWDAQYLSTIDEETMAHIFRPVPDAPPIPLFDLRVAHAREVGQVLLDRYDGQFTNAIEQVEGDVGQLVLLLTEHFPSFRDVTLYRGHEVRFFKRAQICVADIHGAFRGQRWGAFTNMDVLTCFADYKVPQILRHYGILEYEPTLARKVDAQEQLPMGSEEEVEIRASTIWACELLRQEMLRQGHGMNATEIDQRLWFLAQDAQTMRPYHRTRTPFY